MMELKWLDGAPKSADLKVYLRTSNKDVYDQCLKAVQLLRVQRRYYNRFGRGEFDEIYKQKDELITNVCRNNNDVRILFNATRKQIDMYGFDKGCLQQVYAKIDTFCMDSIKSTKTIEIKSDANYEFLKFMMNSKNKPTLKVNLGLDERVEMRLIEAPRNSTICDKLCLVGSKQSLGGLNLNQLVDICVEERNLDLRPGTASFVKFKLRNIQRNMEDKSMLLKFTDSNFQLIGFNNADVEQQAKEINEFVASARSKSILVKKIFVKYSF
jgi:hypothetical protein